MNNSQLIKIEQPLQHNLRTFNKTDSISNISNWLERLYNITLKDIVSEKCYNTLSKNTLATRSNFGSYYNEPKGFSRAVKEMETAIRKILNL